jgi:hypothetical protein
MKRHLDNLQKFLDHRGLTMEEFTKLIVSFGVLFGVTCILVYGAIAALLV